MQSCAQVTGDGWDADLLSDDPPVASPSVPVFRKPVPVESSSMHTVNMHPAVSHNSGTSDDSPAPTSLGRPVSDDTLAANHSASPSDDTRASILSPRPSDTTPATSRALKTPEDTPSSSLTPHAHTKKDTDDETRGNKPTKLTRRGLARLLASTDDDGSEWDMAQLLLVSGVCIACGVTDMLSLQSLRLCMQRCRIWACTHAEFPCMYDACMRHACTTCMYDAHLNIHIWMLRRCRRHLKTPPQSALLYVVRTRRTRVHRQAVESRPHRPNGA